MAYVFHGFRFDPQGDGLRGPGGAVALQPKTLALLRYLIERPERFVPREELMTALWGDRIISDDALASQLKLLRRALDDPARLARIIETRRGCGARFAAAVERVGPSPAGETASPHDAPHKDANDKPCVAVLSFGGDDRALADGFASDLARALARLRWLKVIAPASALRFPGGSVGAARRALKIDWAIAGEVRGSDAIIVDLCEAGEASLVWSEAFQLGLAGRISNEEAVCGVAAALEREIAAREADDAALGASVERAAWRKVHAAMAALSAFSAEGVARAFANLDAAHAIDPDYARAHAARSFAHFQNAFMGFGEREANIGRSRNAAEKAMALDSRDAFCVFNHARAIWIGGAPEEALMQMRGALRLQPSYAMASYTAGLLCALTGEDGSVGAHARRAIAVSPLDPFAHFFHGLEAISLIGEESFEEAARSADRAMQSPHAHAYLGVVAAAAASLHGDGARADAWAARARALEPDICAEKFFRKVPIASEKTRARIARAAARHGLN